MSKKIEELATPDEIKSYFLQNRKELREFLEIAQGIIDNNDDESLQDISLALIGALYTVETTVDLGDEVQELADDIRKNLTDSGI